MIEQISEVDFQRVKDCLQGALTDRGCGKTVARVLLMISAAINFACNPKRCKGSRPKYSARLLFIGENHRHVEDIQRMTMHFLQGLNFEIVSYTVAGGYIQTLFHGWLVDFQFCSPGNIMCRVRGSTYDKAIVDLTSHTAIKYGYTLEEVIHIYVRP